MRIAAALAAAGLVASPVARADEVPPEPSRKPPAVVRQLVERPLFGSYYERWEPTFYTGFAPRADDPARVHLHVGRGNQLRITLVLSEAVQEHPDLVKKYMGSVVPYYDNFYAALNSAVFTDGSFCFIPKGVRCPMELSTYFRINAAQTGQFERTLIVA